MRLKHLRMPSATLLAKAMVQTADSRQQIIRIYSLKVTLRQPLTNPVSFSRKGKISGQRCPPLDAVRFFACFRRIDHYSLPFLLQFLLVASGLT